MKIKLTIYSFTIIYILMITGFTYAASAGGSKFELSYLSSIGAHINDTCKQGKYGFLAQGCFLRILDVSDANHSKEIGVLHCEDEIVSVAVHGDVAYVGLRHGRIGIVDVSDKKTPKLHGYIDEIGPRPYIMVAGNNLLVRCTNPYDIFVFDAREPLDPKEITIDNQESEKMLKESSKNVLHLSGTLFPFEDVRDVTVAKNYAYLADGPGGLKVVNVEDIKNPKLVYCMETKDNAIKFHLNGEVLYLVTNRDRTDIHNLCVLDISSPESPKLLGSYKFTGAIKDMVSQKHRLYLSTYPPTLQILDTGDPGLIKMIKTIKLQETCTSMLIASSNLLLSMNTLHVLLTDTPTTPTPLTTDGHRIKTGEMAVENDYLYTRLQHGINCYGFGLDRMLLKKLWSHEMKPDDKDSGVIYDFKLKDSVAYLPWYSPDDTGGEGGLDACAVDQHGVGDIVHFSGLNEIHGIDIMDRYVFIANGKDGLLILQRKFVQ